MILQIPCAEYSQFWPVELVDCDGFRRSKGSSKWSIHRNPIDETSW